MNADSNDRNSYSKPDECVSFMRMKEAHMLTAQRKAGYNTLVGTENKFVIGHDDFPESVDFKNVRESSLKCYEQVGKFYIAQTEHRISRYLVLKWRGQSRLCQSSVRNTPI